MEQPEIRTEQETRTCACGTPFEANVTTVGRAKFAATVCPSCAEAERASQRAYFVADAGDPRERMAAVGINVRKHGKLTLAALGKSKAATIAYGFATEALDAGPWDFVKGLYLAGPTGVGKTQLAVCVVRHLIEAGLKGRIVVDRSRALITTIQDRYGAGNVDDAIAMRRTAALWVLDDIGTEKPTPDAFRIIEDILDSREGHPTILTSNYEPQGLAERWAEKDALGRFRSRIGPQNYRHVLLDGQDRRFAA